MIRIYPRRVVCTDFALDAIKQRGRHAILFEGDIIGEETLDPRCMKLALKYQIDTYINMTATEPRWEAWSKYATYGVFKNSINHAILECAAKSRAGYNAKVSSQTLSNEQRAALSSLHGWLREVIKMVIG